MTVTTTVYLQVIPRKQGHMEGLQSINAYYYYYYYYYYFHTL